MSEEAKKIILIIGQLKAEGYSDEEIVDFVEDDVIDCNDPELSYDFIMEFFDWATIEDHLLVIANSNSAKFNYLAAKNFRGLNSFYHEEAVLQSNDPLYSYLFLRDIEPIWGIYLKVSEDAKDLLDPNLISIDSDSTDFFSFYDRYIPLIKSSYNIKSLQRFFDDMEIRIYDWDKDAHRDIVLKSGDKKLIEAFKRDVDGKGRTKKL